MNHMIYKRYVKRTIDILLSAVGLVIAAIPLALLAVVIKLDSKGPVLFRQPRLGYKGKVFTV